MPKKVIKPRPRAEATAEAKAQYVFGGTGTDTDGDRTVRVTIDLPTAMHRRFKAVCAVRGITLKDATIAAIASICDEPDEDVTAAA